MLTLTHAALAHPIPPHDDNYDGGSRYVAYDEPTRAPIEWSTWFRVSFGTATRHTVAEPRLAMPQARDSQTNATWQTALGADATLALTRSGNVRFGPWTELRDTGFVGGAELVVQAVPKKIDMFLYDGQGVLALRAGGDRHRVTGQLAYGYLAPWNLFKANRGATRYMIGVRFVATYSRSVDADHDWIASFGIETEPFGALRYLLGIRSWY
jgi:hypothetical protein